MAIRKNWAVAVVFQSSLLVLEEDVEDFDADSRDESEVEKDNESDEEVSEEDDEDDRDDQDEDSEQEGATLPNIEHRNHPHKEIVEHPELKGAAEKSLSQSATDYTGTQSAGPLNGSAIELDKIIPSHKCGLSVYSDMPA